MGLNLTQKLISSHLVSGEMIKGREIGLKIDQTLTQDATGTMAYLQFEAMGLSGLKPNCRLHILTTTPFRRVLKTPTTINTFKAAPKIWLVFLPSR